MRDGVAVSQYPSRERLPAPRIASLRLRSSRESTIPPSIHWHMPAQPSATAYSTSTRESCARAPARGAPVRRRSRISGPTRRSSAAPTRRPCDRAHGRTPVYARARRETHRRRPRSPADRDVRRARQDARGSTRTSRSRAGCAVSAPRRPRAPGAFCRARRHGRDRGSARPTARCSTRAATGGTKRRCARSRRITSISTRNAGFASGMTAITSSCRRSSARTAAARLRISRRIRGEAESVGVARDRAGDQAASALPMRLFSGRAA